jgi:hypothetical protein
VCRLSRDARVLRFSDDPFCESVCVRSSCTSTCVACRVSRVVHCACVFRFRSMTPMYYRGASAAILVYDVTSVESFECVKDWVTGR